MSWRVLDTRVITSRECGCFQTYFIITFNIKHHGHTINLVTALVMFYLKHIDTTESSL